MTELEKLMELLHRRFNRILFVHDKENPSKLVVTYFGYIAAYIDTEKNTIQILHTSEPSTFPIDSIPDDKFKFLYNRIATAIP